MNTTRRTFLTHTLGAILGAAFVSGRVAIRGRGDSLPLIYTRPPGYVPGFSATAWRLDIERIILERRHAADVSRGFPFPTMRQEMPS